MAEHIDHAAMAHGMMFGHGGMDHGGNGDDGMDMPCDMAMLMTWDWPLRRCVVVQSWHLRTHTDVVLALAALVALAVGFEYLRWRMRALDSRLALALAAGHGARHARKASIAAPSASASTSTGGAAHARTASTSTSWLPSASTADRRATLASSASSSSTPPHTGLDMSTADDDDDILREERGPLTHPFHDDGPVGDGIRARTARPFPRAPSTSVLGSLLSRPKPLRVSMSVQVVRAILYGLNVAAGAFLMLVLMTYNIWLIGATVAGAMLGHFLFSRELGLLPAPAPSPSSSSRAGQGGVAPPPAGLVAIPGVDVDKGLACH